MSRSLIYLLLVFCLFSILSLPNLIESSQGFVFIVEELVGAILLIFAFFAFEPFIKKTTLKINKQFPWNDNIIKRLSVGIGLVIFFSILLTIITLGISSLYFNTFGEPDFFKIKEQLLQEKYNQNPNAFPGHEFVIKEFSVFLYTFSIFGGCIFLFTVLFSLEEYIIYNKSIEEKELIREQEAKELALSKVAALQHQLNPHFMFNTLNVLSGLMHEDVEKADKFIKKLSEIYRYVLLQSEEVASSLGKEIEFAKAYVYLLKIRFEDKLYVNIEIDKNELDWFLPSLTLELLIENAIKHNSLEAHNPLEIQIFLKDDNLIVQNNIIPRMDQIKSTGIGIKNLQTRLSALGINDATFKIEEKMYIATIPLIKA